MDPISSSNLNRSRTSQQPEQTNASTPERKSSSSLMCEEKPLGAGVQKLLSQTEDDKLMCVQNMLARSTPANASSSAAASSQAPTATSQDTALYSDTTNDVTLTAGATSYYDGEDQARIGVSALHLSSSSENVAVDVGVLEAEANLGTYNAKDGSSGVNMGFSSNIASVETTFSDNDGNSFTAGVSIGVGAEFSAGTRDSDGDGNTEYCARVGAGPSPIGFVLGGCVEPAGILERVNSD